MTDYLFNMSDINVHEKIERKAYISKLEEIEESKKVTAYVKIKDLIGKLEQNKVIHFSTGAYWSTHDLVFYILSEIGQADLTVATWSFSPPVLPKFIKMHNSGLIKSTNFLFDFHMKKHGDVLAALKPLCKNITLSDCHAKVCVIQNEKWNITIVGSANWSNNPRIEAGTISTSKVVAENNKKWIMEEIKKKDPFKYNKQIVLERQTEEIQAEDKFLVLIRGLPGSGKSTTAELFKDAVICENDQWFVNEKVIRAGKTIGESKKFCFEKCRNEMLNDTKTIVVSNVFSEKSSFSKYEDLAKSFQYKIIYLISENRNGHKNIHGVEKSSIQKMKDKFNIELG